MTQKEFDILVQNAQPYEVFNYDWGVYNPVDFADDLLPGVDSYQATSLLFYDGIKLFEGLQKTSKNVRQLDDGKGLITLISYSYPKGVKAEQKKYSVEAGAHEVCTFIEMDVNENINIYFKFGKSFRDYIRKLGASDIRTLGSSESTVFPSLLSTDAYKTTLTQHKAHFKNTLVHENMMKFIFTTIGIEEKYLKKEALNELSKTLAEYSPLFKAGKAKKGAYSHGSIDRDALKKAGFSEQEIEVIYYGNWLRDYSQIIVGTSVGFNRKDREQLPSISNAYNKQNVKQFAYKPSHSTWVKVLKMLAVKEFIYNPLKEKGQPTTQVYKEYEDDFEAKFGRLTKDILGIYRPEEHIDNPAVFKG